MQFATHKLKLVERKPLVMSTTTKYRKIMDRDEVDADLRDIDTRILDKLEQYPRTRQNLSDELDVSGEYIYQRIDLLTKLGLVETIHDGFYERKDWREQHEEEDDADN